MLFSESRTSTARLCQTARDCCDFFRIMESRRRCLIYHDISIVVIAFCRGPIWEARHLQIVNVS